VAAKFVFYSHKTGFVLFLPLPLSFVPCPKKFCFSIIFIIFAFQNNKTINTVTTDNIKSRQRVVLSILPRKYDFLMELLQNFDFVNVVHENTVGDTQEEIIENLKQAGKELKLVREGKLEGRSAYELLNEL